MKKPKRKPARRFLVGTLSRRLGPVVWGKDVLSKYDNNDPFRFQGFDGVMTREEADRLAKGALKGEGNIYELELVPVKP